jgi:hypothetical protein
MKQLKITQQSAAIILGLPFSTDSIPKLPKGLATGGVGG